MKQLDESVKHLEITPDTILDERDEGVNLFVTGTIKVEDSPADPDFGFVANGHTILYRKVEVLVWEEQINQIEERNGSFVKKGTAASY